MMWLTTFELVGGYVIPHEPSVEVSTDISVIVYDAHDLLYSMEHNST